MTLSRRAWRKITGLVLCMNVPRSTRQGAMSVFGVDEMGYEASFFDNKNYLLLKDITDLIIPATDTAGAVDIGVHRFIDTMLSEWASNKNKNKYHNGLNLINEFVINRYSK